MKHKRIITIIAIIILLFSFGIGSFAMDIVGDGSGSPPPYLYASIPIESIYLKSASGGSTADLDNFVVNCGGYLQYGQATSGSYEVNYGSNRTVSVDYLLSRSTISTDSFEISQTIEPQGSLFVNNTSIQAELYCNPFILNSDYSNTVHIALGSSGTLNVNSVTYRYSYTKITESGETAIDNGIDFVIEERLAQGSYTQTVSGNNFNLFPTSFFEHVQNSTSDYSNGIIGSSDGLNYLYSDDTIYIVGLRIYFNIQYSGDLTNKSFSISSIYNTEEENRPDIYNTFAIYGDIDREVTVINEDFDFSAFSAFIGDTVGGFMNTEILGQVTFGMIVYTVLGIGLLMWILKMFGGG